MDKVYIVYWSQTGNTEAMAKMLASGVEEAGKTSVLVEAENVNVNELLEQKAFALGCPAMGAEELEDSVVEPLVASLEDKIAGKNLVLFGSYDWGDGEWMRLWVERMTNAGATVIGGEGVIANNEPDANAEGRLKTVAKELANL